MTDTIKLFDPDTGVTMAVPMDKVIELEAENTQLKKEYHEAFDHADRLAKELEQVKANPESFWMGKAIEGCEREEALEDKLRELQKELDDNEEFQAMEARLNAALEMVRELRDELTNGDYNSVRETIALMVEGEGSNPQTYKDMARHALTIIDRVLAKADEFLKRRG